jgi:hypothetical protein
MRILNWKLFLEEIGDSSSRPYPWKETDLTPHQISDIDDYHIDETMNFVKYEFKTELSKQDIEVSFNLIPQFSMNYIVSVSKTLKEDEKTFLLKDTSYYWDTNFGIKNALPGSEYPTISKEFRSEKHEVFRIMSTISEIVKDFISKNQVNGFAFRGVKNENDNSGTFDAMFNAKPMANTRDKIFIKYFKSYFTDAKIMNLDGGTIITIKK